MPKVSRGVSLPDEHWRALEHYAEAWGRSVSQVVEALIHRNLLGRAGMPTYTRQDVRKPAGGRDE